MNEVEALIDRLMGGRTAAAARGHLEEVTAGAIDLAHKIDEAGAVVGFDRGLDQHSARAVAE